MRGVSVFPESHQSDWVGPAIETTTRGPDMRKLLAAVVMTISLVPLGAFAQERVGDAALGGLSGAIVFGPVGAVAGIVPGYAASPGLTRSWGLGPSVSRHPGAASPPP